MSDDKRLTCKDCRHFGRRALDIPIRIARAITSTLHYCTSVDSSYCWVAADAEACEYVETKEEDCK